MPKTNSNAVNYLKLAIIHNELFDEEIKLQNESLMNLTELESEKSKISIDNKRKSIAGNINISITNLGPKKRENLFKKIEEIKGRATIEAYTAQQDKSFLDPNTFYALETCNKITRAADYLTILLKINFPEEFPDETINKVLSGKNGNAKDMESLEEFITGISPEPKENAYAVDPIDTPDGDAYTDEAYENNPETLINHNEPTVGELASGPASAIIEELKRIKNIEQTPPTETQQDQ